MTKLIAAVDTYFGLRKSGTSMSREMRAALTTFLTMAYILFVNPDILSKAITIDGVNVFGQLMAATAIAAAFPMPEPAPVTIATFPSSRMLGSIELPPHSRRGHRV